MTLADLRLLDADTGAVGGADDGPRAERPRRRAYSAEYRLAVLDEYDRADGPGAKGACLDYRATNAQWHADRRARRPKVAKLAVSERLHRYVQERLFGSIKRPDGTPVAARSRASRTS